jgi:iron complex outermembrane receptor protein
MTTTSRRLFALFVTLFAAGALHAQTATIAGRVVSSDEEAHPVAGATVRIAALGRGAIASAAGVFAIPRLEPGTYTLTVSSIGYAAIDTVVRVDAGDSVWLELAVDPEEHESEGVVVTGTRTQRTISDVPVRVEMVPQEEIEEKLLMSPANVAMLLNESTGMRVQTTSPTTGSANLRIQGLPGRYTAVLTDGVPNVGGLSSGFGLTELPPLNLRQVEIIKGAASALYGADAIAGVVNFITKDPTPVLEASALFNVTSQKGIDIAGYAGQSFGDVGATLMVSRNTQPRYDVDGDGFADVSEYARTSVSPKLVVRSHGGDMRLDVALGFLDEDRLGGSMRGEPVAEGSDAFYLESIASRRYSATAEWSWTQWKEAVAVKGAAMSLHRSARYGVRPFDADQRVGYGEAQYAIDLGEHRVLVAGVVSLDDFEDRSGAAGAARSYRYVVPGILAQEEWAVSQAWTVLASARVDRHNVYGTFITPRASIMFRPSHALTLRLGGGTGFKAPTIFVEEAEERGFQGVRLAADVRAERSTSATFDVNWRGALGDAVGAEINAAAYLTMLDDALVADDSIETGALVLRNATGTTTTRGAEVSVKMNVDDVKLSVGYTFLYALQNDQGVESELALNPRHSLGAILMWESEDLGARVGLEAYYTGAQRLVGHPTRSTSPSYWVTGLLLEKANGPARLFVNFENMTDTRQTRFDPIVSGDPSVAPVETVPVYAPLEGRVINGGVRFVF